MQQTSSTDISTSILLIFSRWAHTGEILPATCDNATSLELSRNTVSTLSELWKGAMLDVIEQDQLLNLAEATVWVLGEPWRHGTPGYKWRSVFRHEDKWSDGRLFVVEVSEEDTKFI